jgi:hypothetical protein
MARRILNRKELRADFEASERQKTDEDEVEETEDEAEAEDEEDEEGAEAADADDEAGGEEDDEEGDEGDEDAPKKKRKPAKPVKPVKAKAKPRTRTPKVTRMKVVWGVFNNSNARVATFDYPKHKEAVELAAKLTGDKKNTHFVQPIKEPMEEKKEKE